MGMECCKGKNCRATAMVADNISLATWHQTPPKTAEASKDSAYITLVDPVITYELNGVFEASPSHLPTPVQIKAVPIWGMGFCLLVSLKIK